MTFTLRFATASILAMTASAAAAQDAIFSQPVEDRNEALTEQIEEDFERDTTFGNEGRQLGFDGSVALRASAASGNTDNADIGVGANFGYFDGTNGYELGLSYQYGEEEGETVEESLLYDLEYTRDFTPRFYGFAKLQGSIDEFSSFENDTFLGFGAGYRVVNTATTQWSLQAGPGYRVAELSDAVDRDFEEAALSVTSNYYTEVANGISLTNDTDIIASESDTVVYNDLGLNVAMNNALALRTSVQTEYHTEPARGMDDTDNTYGVSLVYSFN
ncbi:Salt-stress induced outer membrane protein [Oceanicola granulosus HTCC2516]|uniref:Salt-stress induced outer membrane protein n=1 Tax=Oceanicola granulosus (strain ATCC BAA-861 / DSM 15982 / KCTC 12143 / HTCC2516) TaxID=314256 RepID=Q2CKD8_OCEGH|nr:DUF481 domain-containing protein [Oceanicola granulosus]EAR52851.1 Salt-stress induced outer membrane protein [Oceanicola granulosus HTCC2516]